MLLEYSLGSGAAADDLVRVVSPAFRVVSMPVRQSVKMTIDELPVYVRQGFVVRVINDTDLPLQTADHKTDCTIVNVQRLENSGWITVAECQLASPTKLIRIEPRQSYLLKLPGAGGPGYPAGTYRVEFNYQTINSDGQTLGANNALYSPEFMLRERQ